MPFVAVGSFFGCMGGPEGWNSTSSMKILGCAYCAWISASSIMLALLLTGGAAAVTGLTTSVISGGVCGFFGAFAK